MRTDYSKMSDFEINCRVHSEVMEISGLDSFKAKDYCNNPSDAWPIIIDNKISIVSLDNKWLAAPVDAVIDGITGDSDVCFYASCDAVSAVNPLRAAMTVFLVMQESKNAS